MFHCFGMGCHFARIARIKGLIFYFQRVIIRRPIQEAMAKIQYVYQVSYASSLIRLEYQSHRQDSQI